MCSFIQINKKEVLEMEIGRVVNTKLWKDEKVENFTPEEKYFWLFLLTNPETTQLGIYHITYKTMAFYTGYEIETCRKLIDRFENEYEMIKYSENEIAIKNFLRYGVNKGGKPIEDLLNKEINQVQDKDLLYWMFGNIDLGRCNETVKAMVKQYENEIKESKVEQKVITELDKALKDFEVMRNKIKKPLTLKAKQMILNKLDKLASDDETKIAILNQSIMHCWQDIYELKDNSQIYSNNQKFNKDTLPVYSTDKNVEMSKQEANELLKLMGKK